MLQLSCNNKALYILFAVAALQLLLVIWYFDVYGRARSNFKLSKFDRPNMSMMAHLEMVSSEVDGELGEQKEVIQIIIDEKENITLRHYLPREKYNSLTITYPQNCTKKDRPVNSEKFFLITNFIYLKHKNYVGNLAGFVVNNITLEARIMEIIKCLQGNLNHPFIEEVHVLVKEREAIEYLRRLPLKNSQKLIIHVPDGLVSMKTQLEYAGQCLMDQIVAIAHQDNLFGSGWDQWKPEILKKQRIAYALTRHTPEHSPCQGAKGSANCDHGYPYLGSHDVFMFHVKEKFDSSLLTDIKGVTPNLYGMENLFIWVFNKKLNYKVLNPCYVLYVHHHHCIPIRDMGRRRVNKAETTGYAGFTDKLE